MVGHAERVQLLPEPVNGGVERGNRFFIGGLGFVQPLDQHLVCLQLLRQVVGVESLAACVIDAVGLPYEVDGGVVLQVGYVEHHAAYLLAHELVHLPLGGAWTGLVKLVIRGKRYGRAVTHEHFLPGVEVVGVVVARGQHEHFLLETSLPRRFEQDVQVGQRELPQPMLVLVPRFGVNHHRAVEQQFLLDVLEGGGVVGQRCFAVEGQPVGGDEPQPMQGFPDCGLEHVGAGHYAYFALVPAAVNGHEHAQHVRQAVLVVGHHHQWPLGGYAFRVQPVSLFIENLTVEKAYVGFEQLETKTGLVILAVYAHVLVTLCLCNENACVPSGPPLFHGAKVKAFNGL